MTKNTVRLERTLSAPIERVYAAWTDPSLLTRWYCPNPAWEVKVEGDIAVGGDYRVHMGDHVVEGTYTELQPPSVIAFTWRWLEFDNPASQVRVELTEVDGGTHLLLVHSDLADAEDARNHEEGWVGCLTRLVEVV
ncbi:MAG TPA: SRPBCC domain-containing protein [Nocardioidaceae bacterium]|jgi:uncharacterized protein YndB with AHSA1/START domain|nr:SRPBCC domain-containing protein [Nocardioidaceae bacterium]